MAALAGCVALVEGADDAEAEEHAGAGVADRRAGLDRPAVDLAGDAHRAAAGLRDRVEAQPLLVRAACAEAFYLGIDDAWVEFADDIIAEAQPLDGAGREVLGEDIGFAGHVLDQLQTTFGFEVDGDRFLVGVVRHEIIRVRDAAATGFTALRGLHLDDFGTHPGERLGATRPGLELRQIEDFDAGETVWCCGVSIHVSLLQ